MSNSRSRNVEREKAGTRPSQRFRGHRATSGQSLIESCVVIALISLIFMGLFQISQLFAAREILYHAAARGVRAKTVGFNRWMVEKAIRVASIPNAGKMTVPGFENEDLALRGMLDELKPGDLWSRVLGVRPSSGQAGIEKTRIPEYMASHNRSRSRYVLDYENWDTIEHDSPSSAGSASIIEVKVAQDYRIWVPLHRTFYAADTVNLEGESALENHYSLYLDDMRW